LAEGRVDVKSPVVAEGALPMSALGHKQTFAVQNVMSAFTPNSGHLRRTSLCPLCANSGHRPDLLDHLICTQQKLFGDRQTQRFGGGQIDD
jgi:hypothetical protein